MKKPSPFLHPYAIALVLTFAIHAALGGGLEAADRWAHGEKKKPKITVAIVPQVREEPKEEVKKEEPKKEEPKLPEDQPLPKPKDIKPPTKTPPPPKSNTPPPEQPKEPPKVDEPPPLYTVARTSTTTGQSSVSVPTSETGNYKGSPDGKVGGKGKPQPKVGTPEGDPDGKPGGTGNKPYVPVVMKTPPKVKKEIEARYPAEAERLGIEGAVKLSVTIDATGKVIAVKVLKGLGYGMDEAAVEALKRFEFAPAMGSDDKPMKWTIVYTYKYTIE